MLTQDELPDSELSLVTQVRPWVRYWARYIDGGFYALIVMLLVIPLLMIESVNNFVSTPLGTIFLVLVVSVCGLFLEAAFFSVFGVTLGKWLFRIKVLTADGKTLGYKQALNRALDVWIIGRAFGVPFLSLFAGFKAYNELLNEKITRWDKEGSFVVTHERIGPVRVLIGGIVIIFIILLSFATSHLPVA